MSTVENEKQVGNTDNRDNNTKNNVEDQKYFISSTEVKKKNINNSHMSQIYKTVPLQGGSLLYQPHRTIGIITYNKPFYLSENNRTSIDTFITLPFNDRFIMYKCDALRPVIVSDRLVSSLNPRKNDRPKLSGEEGDIMHHSIFDSSLSITVTTHSSLKKHYATHVTLFRRTVVKATIMICSAHKWGIIKIINLGRSVVDYSSDIDRTVSMSQKEDVKEGNNIFRENVLILALLCAKQNKDIQKFDKSYSLNSSKKYQYSSSESEKVSDLSDRVELEKYYGEIVILIASRTKLQVRKRIPLTSLSLFFPSVGMHPHTYLNKILVGSTNGEIILVNVRSGKIVHQFKCLLKNNYNNINQNNIISMDKGDGLTTMEQSPMVDTIAIGTSLGNVHLVNIRKDVRLFTLTHEAFVRRDKICLGHVTGVTSLSFRTDSSALSCGIAPLAVGLSDGSISIWDLNSNLYESKDRDSGNTKYHRMIFNNSRKLLLCQMENIHPGGVCKLAYFPQEPLLLSSGISSNKLVMHVFDNPDHSGRVLRQRVGHTAPPRLIRYRHLSSNSLLAPNSDGTDAASCQIISCGGKDDKSLRIFSTARSVLDRELSQGKGLVKRARELKMSNGKSELLLNEVIAISTCEARTRHWGNLVTIHRDHAFAYVWNMNSGVQCGPVLRQLHWNVSEMKVPPPCSAHATAVVMSSCGNFAIVGTRGGLIYKYNIESGLPRGSFPNITINNGRKNKRKSVHIGGDLFHSMKTLERDLNIGKSHFYQYGGKMANMPITDNNVKNKTGFGHLQATVTGLAVDTLNKILISVGSDAKLIVWSLISHSPISRKEICLPSSATMLVHMRDSDLIAIALQNFSVILYDCVSHIIVRIFGTKDIPSSHTGPITDIAFYPDGRRLLTSSFDKSIRVWDIPTNTCIDWLNFVSPPTSITVSSTGEFLATTHVGKLGISLWYDRSYFQTVHLDGSRSIIKSSVMDEPEVMLEESRDKSEKFFGGYKGENTDLSLLPTKGIVYPNKKKNPPVPKESSLITLSGLPSSHWKNLFHLENVKDRNRPSESPKKIPNAPFFLQWRAGDNGTNKKYEEEYFSSCCYKEEDINKEAIDCVHRDKSSFTKESYYGEKKKKKSSNNIMLCHINGKTNIPYINKSKNEVYYSRSHLASLLEHCYESSNLKECNGLAFEAVTLYLATLGPSAIDVELFTLCNGMHDSVEGLHYIHIASMWLLEACLSRQNYEAINAYLHRFLFLHSSVIAGIDNEVKLDKNNNEKFHNREDMNRWQKRSALIETIGNLRYAQKLSTECLANKMQSTLCLLKHFSMML